MYIILYSVITYNCAKLKIRTLKGFNNYMKEICIETNVTIIKNDICY